MSKIQFLKEFLESSSVKEDPYYHSIFQADFRNIFPKHQLCKIQLMKNKISKTRLILQNLDDFLSLQIYSKKMLDLSKNQEVEINKSLDIMIDECQKENQKQKINSNYEFQIVSFRQKIPIFCEKINKKNLEEKQPQLKNKINQVQKWKNYLNQNQNHVQNFDPVMIQKDKIALANLIDLSQANDNILLHQTSGQIIEDRVKQQVMKDRLKHLLYSGKFTFEENQIQIKDDPWQRQWNEVIRKIQS